jgi:calcineurin-like phosphoesterase family protein
MLGWLVVLLQMTKPYNDIEVTDKYIIREFNENIDPIELLWHRDDEARTVEILKKQIGNFN